MRKLVRDLRRTKTALGDGIKKMYPSEAPAYAKMGKKLVAARNLPEGHVITEADVSARSPGDGGLAPFEMERVLGRRLKRSLTEHEAFSLEILDGVPTSPPQRSGHRATTSVPGT
jgi:N-acetylneuraminate synthase/sialic acid synthase